MNNIENNEIITNEQKVVENTVQNDPSFSYDGYQVVRGEFFAHLFEPSVTFKDEKVSVNVACLNKLPSIEYVQFLVNPVEKKLAVKPCSEEVKDSFCWASINKQGKRKPKMISCKIFYAKVMNLMNWNPEYRYKILGKLIRSQTDILFVFDLASAETYVKKDKDSPESKRKAYYPEEWKNQFGVPVKDHEDMTLVSIFDDYTVFTIEKKEESEVVEEYDSNDIPRYEEETDTDTQTDSSFVE